jgi:hypothetical protein
VVIFGLKDDSLGDCFVGHRLFNGFLEAFVEQALSVSEGHVQAGSDLRGEFFDFLVKFVGIINVVDQSDLFGAVRPEDITGEDQLLGDVQPDEPRQKKGGPRVDAQADLSKKKAEASVWACDLKS